MEGRTRDFVPYLAAAIGGVLLIHGAAAYLFWKDAGELSAAAADMGVPHPTGFTLWTSSARTLGFLPLGSLDLRYSLVSVLGLVLCIMILSSLMGHAFRKGSLALPVFADSLVRGVALPLLILSSDTAYYLATTPEVYTVGACLALAQMWALIVPTEPLQKARLCGGLVGLAPTTHVTGGFGFVSVFLARATLNSLPTLSRLKAALRTGMVPFVLALAGVLALVFAAGSNPELNFGNPDDLGGLWQHLTGASIHEAFAAEGVKGDDATYLWEHLSFLVRDVGVVSLVCALLALSFALSDLVVRSLWALVALDLAFSLVLNPMGRVDLQTGLLTVCALAALTCIGLAHLSLFVASRWESARARTLWSGIAVLVVLVARAPAVEANWSDRAALSHDTSALQVIRMGFQPLKTGTVVFTNGDDIIATTLAARLVDGRRPDLIQVITPYAWWPWRAEKLGKGVELEPLRLALNVGSRGGIAPSKKQQHAILRAYLRWANARGAIAWEAGAPMFEKLLGDRMHAGFPFAPVQATPRGTGSWLSASQVEALFKGRDDQHSWSRRIISDGLRISATVAARKGAVGEALEWNRAALSLDRGNGRAWGNRGVFQLRQGKEREAIESLNNALILRPADARVWRNLGLAYSQVGELEAARDALKTSLRYGRDHAARKKAKAMLEQLPQ